MGYGSHTLARLSRFGTTYGSQSASAVASVMDSEEGRRALNETSLHRVSYPVHYTKPKPCVNDEGLHLKFTPS